MQLYYLAFFFLLVGIIYHLFGEKVTYGFLVLTVISVVFFKWDEIDRLSRELANAKKTPGIGDLRQIEAEGGN